MIREICLRRVGAAIIAAYGAIALAAPGGAQVRSIDPDAAFHGTGADPSSYDDQEAHEPAPPPAERHYPPASPPSPGFGPETSAMPQAPTAAAAVQDTTYSKEDLVHAAEGAFGKAARDVAVAIGDVLEKQGRPNGYIVGSEGGGAFIFGLRYGSGMLHQKTAPPRKVHWTGPSIGFDAGANGGDTFVLVYNLDDPEALFSRFGSGEGQAYIVGGLHVSYLRRDNVVLIPVRMGVGIRLGVNAGYMKFSRRQNWLPF